MFALFRARNELGLLVTTNLTTTDFSEFTLSRTNDRYSLRMSQNILCLSYSWNPAIKGFDKIFLYSRDKNYLFQDCHNIFMSAHTNKHTCTHFGKYILLIKGSNW